MNVKLRDIDVAFSLIIPFFNKGISIFSTLESINCQKYKNFEVIIVDDGSTSVLDIDANSFGFDLTIVKTPNQGVSVARNTGASLSKNDWLIFLDAGDSIEDLFLYEVKKSISTHSDIMLHSTGFSFVKNDIKIKAKNSLCSEIQTICYKDYIQLLIQMNQLFHICSFCVHKSIFFSVNGFSVGATHGEDHEFILKTLNHVNNMMFINKPLFNYSLDDDCSVTRSKNKIPIYSHSWYFNDKKSLTSIELDYFTSTVVDNFIVNLRNNYISTAMKNTLRFIAKIRFSFFIKIFFIRALSYAKK